MCSEAPLLSTSQSPSRLGARTGKQTVQTADYRVDTPRLTMFNRHCMQSDVSVRPSPTCVCVCGFSAAGVRQVMQN